MEQAEEVGFDVRVLQPRDPELQKPPYNLEHRREGRERAAIFLDVPPANTFWEPKHLEIDLGNVSSSRSLNTSDRSDRSDRSSISQPAVHRCCAGSVPYRFNEGNVSYIMQIISPPTTNMSYTMQMRNTYVLKDLHHEVGVDDLSVICPMICQ